MITQKVYWVLDVIFNEDKACIAKEIYYLYHEEKCYAVKTSYISCQENFSCVGPGTD